MLHVNHHTFFKVLGNCSFGDFITPHLSWGIAGLHLLLFVFNPALLPLVSCIVAIVFSSSKVEENPSFIS